MAAYFLKHYLIFDASLEENTYSEDEYEDDEE